jgi:hypothetical protein
MFKREERRVLFLELQREKRENVTSLKGANRKEKHIFAETPLTHGPDGPARKALACGEGRPRGAGWAKGQVGR